MNTLVKTDGELKEVVLEGVVKYPTCTCDCQYCRNGIHCAGEFSTEKDEYCRNTIDTDIWKLVHLEYSREGKRKGKKKRK